MDYPRLTIWEEYIGIPYLEYGVTPQGCDCWGLIRLIYADELNIILPNIDNEYHSNKMLALNNEAPRWLKVDTIKPFDVLVFKFGRAMLHVGLAIGNGLFVHNEDKASMSCVDLHDEQPYSSRLHAIYRHKDMTCK